GQDGFDTLVFNGANINEKCDIEANGTRARLTRDIGTVAMDINGIEHVQLNAGAGSDNIVVGDLTGTGVTQVTIDLAGLGTTAADGELDQVTVNGTAGNDQITVSTSGTAVVGPGLTEQGTRDHSDAGDSPTTKAGAGDDTGNTPHFPAGITGL